MITLNTDYLKKNSISILSDSINGIGNSCLSNQIITDFIDDYFGGIIETDVVDNNLVLIRVKIAKNTIDDYFLDKYFSKIETEEIIEDVELPTDFTSIDDDEIEFVLNTLDEISEEDKNDIICDTFSALVGIFGSSLIYENILEFIEFKSV
jgi:hypothetical protein